MAPVKSPSGKNRVSHWSLVGKLCGPVSHAYFPPDFALCRNNETVTSLPPLLTTRYYSSTQLTLYTTRSDSILQYRADSRFSHFSG
ncbi:unnamed protein product [Dicrocoelium dendriticum]|nr:unnamed protein product [Dicrocoelium dendriticum]